MRGKKSILTKVKEDFGKTLWELLEENCSKCVTKEEVCEEINKTLNGYSLQPASLYANIKKAEKEGENLSKLITDWVLPTGKRGKKAVRLIIEEKVGSLWGLLKEHCSSCSNSEEACQILNSILGIHGIEIKENTLFNTIERAIQSGELTDEFFTKWVVRKRKNRTKNEVSEDRKQTQKEIKKNLVALQCECQNCGKVVQRIFNKEFLKTLGSGIRALKCEKCNLWGTFKIDSEIHQEYIEDWERLNPSFKKEKVFA